jgi:TetR/AcrR family transcriptional repressor of mexJK operon
MHSSSDILDCPAPLSPKRRAVIDAATELFMNLGYGAVSMDAIARAAGVSKATLYAHFTSKDALFASIVNDGCRTNTLAEGNFPDEVEDIGITLRTMGRRILRFLIEPRTLGIYRVIIAESARFPELGEAFYANGPGLFRERFAAWAAVQTEAGHLAITDGRVAAEHFIALLRTSIFMRATLGIGSAATDEEIEATVESAIAVFLKAYGQRS